MHAYIVHSFIGVGIQNLFTNPIQFNLFVYDHTSFHKP